MAESDSREIAALIAKECKKKAAQRATLFHYIYKLLNT